MYCKTCLFQKKVLCTIQFIHFLYKENMGFHMLIPKDKFMHEAYRLCVGMANRIEIHFYSKRLVYARKQ